MKKLIPLLLIVLIIVFGALISKDYLSSHIIILKDDTRIITDETWVVDDKVFYKIHDRTHYIAIDKVLDIKEGGLKEGSEIALLIKLKLASLNKTIDGLLAGVDTEKMMSRDLITRIGTVLIGILFCIGLAIWLIKKRKTRRPKKKKEKKEAPKTDITETVVEHKGQEIVVKHFLDIFKAQKGGDEDAPTALRPVKSKSNDGNFIYELRVKLGEDWTSRRMTLGPIGEDSGSRSKCYYVIYDDHIVVKVPPTPLKEFKRYQLSLQREADIARILAPRECLIPGISVILKKVHPFYEDTALSADQLEDKYVEWIEENPEYQRFLKIEGAYAYFMDLSKYFFMGSIIDKMHDPQHNIPKEITEHPDIIWDNMAFEARYGNTCGEVCSELQPVFTTFKNRIQEYLQQNPVGASVENFQIKEWFLLYLGQGKLNSKDLGLKAGTASGLNGIAAKLFNEKKKPIEIYRRMIRTYVVNKNLTRNKAQISGMITNLLDLLAWLHTRKVAMRDLKPDNLLVAGDPTNFPQFLESASLYSIGLIDVETAVCFEPDEKDRVAQPLLGGTPSHATPTHTFPNELIRGIYGDLPLILHLQDWHAAIAMIYKTVTGERLFRDTAKTLIEIKGAIRKGAKKKNTANETLAEASRLFWSCAMDEFERKTTEKEKKLKYISLIITANIKELFLPMVQETHRQLKEAVKKLILEQTAFKSGKIKKSLFSASYIKVSRFKLKFTDDADSSLSEADRKKAIAVLNELEILKKQTAQLTVVLKIINKSVPIISSYDLLRVMFYIVLVNMHQNIWGVVKKG